MEDEDERMASGGEDGGSSEPDVEMLVAGRAKRATAGNRLHALLGQEEPDDELELLFAESAEEEDMEFDAEDDAASDVELDSSSDDDDQGPTAGADDLEGETELQRQAKAERRKKRKQQEVVKRPIKRIDRKLKVDPTAPGGPMTPTIPQPKPDKKKSERVSWLPTPDEGPVRSSSRKHTMQNKAATHQRLKENEKRRKKQLQVLNEAAKRRAADKPKELTQADRMAEAARVEQHNAKSLNHWEEEERRRADERKAKLAALKNRKLVGPYITWWSGPAIWVDGKLAATGRKRTVEEVTESALTKARARAVALAELKRLETRQSTASEANGTRQSTAVAETTSQAHNATDPAETENGPQTASEQPTKKGEKGTGANAGKEDAATNADSASGKTAKTKADGEAMDVDPPTTESSRANATGDPQTAEQTMNGATRTSEEDETNAPSSEQKEQRTAKTTSTEAQPEHQPTTAEPQLDAMEVDQPAVPEAPKADPASNGLIARIEAIKDGSVDSSSTKTEANVAGTQQESKPSANDAKIEAGSEHSGNDRSEEVTENTKSGTAGQQDPSSTSPEEATATASVEASTLHAAPQATTKASASTSQPVQSIDTTQANPTTKANSPTTSPPPRDASTTISRTASASAAPDIDPATITVSVSRSARNLVVLQNIPPGTFSDHILMRPSHGGGGGTSPPKKRIYRTAKVRAAQQAAAEAAAAQGLPPPELVLTRPGTEPPPPPPPQCAVTGRVARFRDPSTGILYADAYAYRQIHAVVNNTPRWSALLGAFTGSRTEVARGVPEKFMGVVDGAGTAGKE